ncbi:MAG TPA: hypothetical protein VEA16_20895 [Vicinamibacterales bacterium]|nr:hypothetical protein [Vicinamibacterales bacterium]
MDATRLIVFLSVSLALPSPLAANGKALEPAVQARVEAKFAQLKAMAKDPVIVAAVKAHNAALPPEHAAMTQEKWATFSVIHPFVAEFVQNEVGKILTARKGDQISEIFVSDARGLKVAFFAKPTSWSHKGKPKHEVPMSGKIWQGDVETDQSTGVREIQISVPVLDGGRPIGSLVAGLNYAKLM